MKKLQFREIFDQKISKPDCFSLSFPFQTKCSRLHYMVFWEIIDPYVGLSFSIEIRSVWTKNLGLIRKNRPPRAAGLRLCIMGVGEPKVTQSVVKSLASSGPFEKIIKN